MIHTGWRLQRTETAIAAAIVALVAALLVPTGLSMASAYSHDGLSACTIQVDTPTCGALVQSFFSRFGSLTGLTSWLTLLPGLVGVLLAAPFVLELESGTFRFAWTQSVTRRRWIAGKLGLAAAAGLAFALALTLLETWWRTPFVHLEGRLTPQAYDSEGTVVFGYVLFALGLGAALGTLWRRAVPALLSSFGIYVAARIFVDTWLRQRFLSPVSATWRTNAKGPDLAHGWAVSQGPSDRSGHYLGMTFCRPHGFGVRACAQQVRPGTLWQHAVYHPASQFWTLQAIETALFAGVGVALLALAAWWTHERVA